VAGLADLRKLWRKRRDHKDLCRHTRSANLADYGGLLSRTSNNETALGGLSGERFSLQVPRHPRTLRPEAWRTLGGREKWTRE
jgi:hypothetical protein